MISYKDRIFDKNIVEIVQQRINQLNQEHWSTDECMPEFIVSILYDYEHEKGKKDQYIILTCKHLSSVFSGVLFPKYDNIYGYESLLDEMNGLYNQTM